jgi:hypothetical protein
MSGSIVDRLLGGQGEYDEVIPVEKKVVEKTKKDRAISVLAFFEFLLVLAIAIIPRLLYIFVFSNPNFPGWYTDVFHHWQIAYLSKEVGFSQGFLRLWDFKGMEFFWGLMHPLVLVILFYITGSISILVPRLLSVAGGSLAIALLFLLIKKYFNRQSAWAVAIFATFFPITLFSNTVGMQEELAIPFVFASFLTWSIAPVLSGIFLAIASMVRAEYWLFAFGLVIASFLLKKKIDKAIIVLLIYSLFMVVYMKYLANYTGSFIYPIKWNFLASVKGEWMENLPVIGEKLLAKRIAQGIFAFGVLGAFITLIKRPRHMLLFLFGFGNIFFIGFMIGFGDYVRGYITRFWVDRFFSWPYLFTATLLILLFFFYLPKKFKFWGHLWPINWAILIIGLAISQLTWRPINTFMEPVEKVYKIEELWASEIANAYQDGKVLLPEDRPYITYFLAHDYGIEGKNMVGQMFDPFFYVEDKDNVFYNWGEVREVVFDWLKSEDIKLIALTTEKPTYLGMIEREGSTFKQVPSDYVLLYRVEFE